MKRQTTFILAVLGATLVATTALLTPGCTCGPRVGDRATRVETVTYHGWENSIRLANDHAEVIVVPAIGRVMSFRLRNGENVLWEDRSLDGKRGDPTGSEWINFGGDKTWPAPEAEWGNYTGRKVWMPPSAFDGLPATATVTNNEVLLTSPVDPHYGVRAVRRIRLHWNELSITTTYERVSGEPSKIGVWVITQFKDPLAIYVPVQTNSIFAGGHFKFSNEPWTQLQHQGRHLEITRDPKAPHKMGCDAHRLLWVGAKELCLVTTKRVADAEYPDRGASAEVYTNPDPKKYIELEMLGPLSLMKPGDRISLTTRYSLHRRMKSSPDAERQWLGF